MQIGSHHEPIFEQAPSGLLLPIGSSTSLWKQGNSSYVHIKGRALDLGALIRANGLDVRRSQSISRFTREASELSDAWLCNAMHTMTIQHLLATLQIDRVTQATTDLLVDELSRVALAGLLTGNLDLLQRKPSKAKDTLWEIELHHMLTQHGISAELKEPDILLSLTGPRLGIACKKLYSEANVSKVVSNAIAQIERHAEFGIVALNIDDLLPPDSLLKAPSTEVMSNILVEHIRGFLARHERHLLGYLKPGRALAILVSYTTIADVETIPARFLNARQSVAWKLPGLATAKEEQMTLFIAALRSQYPNTAHR